MRFADDDPRLRRLLRANNIFFLIAFVLNRVLPWLLYFALIFWIFVLICLIRRDWQAQRLSFATVFYGVLPFAAAGLVAYATFYSVALLN